MKYTIKDNYLEIEDFISLQTYLLDPNFPRFPWIWSKIILNNEDKYNFQLVHVFYLVASGEGIGTTSPQINILAPLLTKLNPNALLRIKANLNPCTDKIIEHTFHTDPPFLPNTDSFDCLTSIFYITRNNRHTKFEDGTVVDSVQNRLLTFPSNTKHTGTTCTDEPHRIVININYL